MRERVLLLAVVCLGACSSAPEGDARDGREARTAANLALARAEGLELAAAGLDAFEARLAAAEVAAYQPAVDALVRTALVEGRAYDNLSALCAAAPHRLAGSEGAAAAVEWGQRAMLADGLENVRLEPVTVPVWVRGEVQRLVLVSPPELAGVELPILALGGSIATPPVGLEAEVVEITSWEQLEALDATGLQPLAGRIAFFNRPMDPALLHQGEAYGRAVDQRSRGASEAARRGAVAAIVRSMTTSLDDFPHTGAMNNADDAPQVPAAAVSTLGAERLSAALRSGQRVVARLQLDCHTLPDAPSHNVVGEIVGRERPDEVVVLGGHLDCWDVGQGAMDDGGGCCQAIEALRLMQSLGLRPRRTVRAVLFMNEENGLRGARAYHATHAAGMPGHLLAIESDSGPFTPRAFTTDANDQALAVLQEIGKLLAATGLQEVRPGGGGADIDPMRADGVIVMSYAPDTQRYFDLHHSARDTIEQISPREIALGAACMAAMAYVVADLEQPLPRNPPRTAE
jgi:carboxypeptidase Q